MNQHVHGSLDGLTDSEHRPLRPIGMTVREAAARTGELLSRVAEARGVRLFAGVRVGPGLPPVAFALSRGPRLLLVESVAWPVGGYTTTPQGRVLCDGTYIGQSVRPLLGACRRLHRVLPRHRVAAAVVVHPCGPGTLTLPQAAPPALLWLPPDEVRRRVSRQLRTAYCHSDTISWYARSGSRYEGRSACGSGVLSISSAP